MSESESDSESGNGNKPEESRLGYKFTEFKLNNVTFEVAKYSSCIPKSIFSAKE